MHVNIHPLEDEIRGWLVAEGQSVPEGNGASLGEADFVRAAENLGFSVEDSRYVYDGGLPVCVLQGLDPHCVHDCDEGRLIRIVLELSKEKGIFLVWPDHGGDVCVVGDGGVYPLFRDLSKTTRDYLEGSGCSVDAWPR